MSKNRLSAAIALAISAGLSSPLQAQQFPAVIELSELASGDGFVMNGEAEGDYSGYSVSNAGDVNGDGIADVLVGAFFAEPNGSFSGRSYVVYGSDSGFPGTLNLSSLNRVNGFAIDGQEFDLSGLPLNTAGDINDDGIDDFLIGASGASRADRVYVVFGSDGGLGFANPFNLSDIDGMNGFTVVEQSSDAGIGAAISTAGDINGDDIDDLIIGAPSATDNGSTRGRGYVIYGADDAIWPNPFDQSTLDGLNGFVLSPQTSSRTLGSSVSAAGDVNGDGVDDLIIGEQATSRAYVVFGSSSTVLPNPFNVGNVDGSNGFIINGLEDGVGPTGITVSNAGDVNGDGIDDVIMGQNSTDINATNSGSAYVVFGTRPWTAAAIDVSSLNGVNGFVVNGEAEEDNFGRSLRSAGDVNGDGFDDLIIGAAGEQGNVQFGGTSPGRSYVIFGSDDAFSSPFDLSSLDGQNGFVIIGAAEADYSGTSVSGGRDINGDGVDDLIIGAPYADPNGNYSGSSYVLFGRASFDVAIAKSNGSTVVDTNEITTWSIEVTNLTGATIEGATLTDPVPLGVTNASWTCTGFDGAVCANPSGSGGINETVNLPPNSRLEYQLTATVTAQEPDSITNTASITLASEQTDINPANNSASDTDSVGLFADSFESEN